MNVIYRILPVLLTFLTLAAFSWIWGGARSQELLPVMPWVWALGLETLLFFPQRHEYEDIGRARSRVWRSLGHDPALYAALVFVAILVIPLFNKALCPVCDYPAIMAGGSKDPPVPLLPFCVDIRAHYGVIQWFVPAFTATLAARHALLKDGKRLLFEMMVWNAAAIAVFGFVQTATGAVTPYWGKEPAPCYYFSVFGYPNMGGAFFTMAAAYAFGLWRLRTAEVEALPPIDNIASTRHEQVMIRVIRANYPALAALFCFFGALATLSRAAIMLTFALAALAFLYVFIGRLFARKNRAQCVKRAALSLVGLAVFAGMVGVFAPEDLTKELSTVDSAAVLDRISGKAQYHTRVATAIFKAHPVFGVGGWGYQHLCLSYMTDDEVKQLQTIGGANVHNDHLQFLAEHGAVGYGMLVIFVIALAWPVFVGWRNLYRVARFAKPAKAPPRPVALYAVPAPVLWMMLGNAALMVHACGDCPMRSAAVLTMFFLSIVAADGFLPEAETDDEDED